MDIFVWFLATPWFFLSFLFLASSGNEIIQVNEESVAPSKLGVPGVDFPTHSYIPFTLFSCKDFKKPGLYADIYADCQVYHVCEGLKTGRRGSAFLCPTGTVFNQQKLICDWWYNVDCYKSPRFF